MDMSWFSQGSVEWIYLLRLMLSCICGFVVGLERTRRQKEAGLRTHILVAMGAALVMMVSKYGFFDSISYNDPHLSVDASRIGSTILTAIGFLGAGMILQRGGAVRGFTTAAGIWVTAAVGMALGAGMYVLGIACTVLLVFIQVVLKRIFGRIDDPPDNPMALRISDDGENAKEFLEWLHATFPNCRISRLERENGKLMVTVVLNDHDYEIANSLVSERPEVELMS